MKFCITLFQIFEALAILLVISFFGFIFWIINSFRSRY